MTRLVPEMEQSNNQGGKTDRKNQQQHDGEGNDTAARVDAVADNGSFSSLCPQKPPRQAHAPSEGTADRQTADASHSVAANLRTMAEYGVLPTRKMKRAAARPVMSPSLIRAWAQYGQNLGTVNDLPAWLASLLTRVNGLPPPGHGSRRNDGYRRPAHPRGRRQEGTWTEAELNQSSIEALVTPPIHVEYSCASVYEYLMLSDDERERREADMPRRVAEWAAEQTGEGAEAIRAAGGAYYGSDKFLPITDKEPQQENMNSTACRGPTGDQVAGLKS
jgi:hypothetical protein